MMRRLTDIRGFVLAFLLAVLTLAEATAQVGNSVIAGQIYGLGVIEVPGETYEWKIYSDHTLLIEAFPPDVIFLSGNTGPAISVLWGKSGTYYFTVTTHDPTGCMNLKVGLIVVTEELKLTPSVVIMVDKNPICTGTIVQFTAFPTNQGTKPIYQWFKNGNKAGWNKPNYVDSQLNDQDLITCQLTSSENKASPTTVMSNEVTMVVYTTTAAFSITENIGNTIGRIQMNNQSTGAEFFYWDFGNGQTSNEVNPTVTYYDDGIYLITLTASNAISCADTFSSEYEMLFKGLYIPNAFAPTSSSTPANLFKPVGINLKRYSIEVYDNWGHLIWESSTLDEKGRPTEAWDGTYHGSLMPQGTYMWKVNAMFKDNTIWQGSDIGKGKGKTIGTVTLIR